MPVTFKHPDGSGTLVRVDDSDQIDALKEAGWEESDAKYEAQDVVTTDVAKGEDKPKASTDAEPKKKGK